MPEGVSTEHKVVDLKVIDWTKDQGYALSARCIAGNSGGPVLIRVKETGSVQEQFELVGIGVSPTRDFIKTSLCNQELNTEIDAQIIREACSPPSSSEED